MARFRELGVGVGCAALLGGCLVSPDTQVKQAFTVAHNCPVAQITLKPSGTNKFEASGCGKQEVYSCNELSVCSRVPQVPLVLISDAPSQEKLEYSTKFEPDGVLNISAWPEGAGHPIALSFSASERDACKLELVVDDDIVELVPGRSGVVDLDSELLQSLRDAYRLSLRGCGGVWPFSAAQLHDLQNFAQKYAERLPADAKRVKADARRAKNAPEGGWSVWKGLSAFPNASATAEPMTGPQLFEKLAPSVLKVEVTRASGYAQGSAVAVTSDLALTNCHVVELARGIVLKQGSQQWEGAIAESDPSKDRCVLKVKGATLTPVQGVRPYVDLKVGEPLYALGAPSGLDMTLTDGILSARREESGVRYVQTTTPISPGSSGGGLFDARGNLVGITTLSFVGKERPNQSLNFAIAAEMFWSP